MAKKSTANNNGWISHRDLLLSVMANKYEKYAKAWKNERDDRVVMSNIYYMVTEALKELNDDNLSCWTRVALNNARKAEEAIMDEIIDRFTVGTCKDVPSSAKEGYLQRRVESEKV